MPQKKNSWFTFRSPKRVEIDQLYGLICALSVISLLFPILLNGNTIIDGWRLSLVSLIVGFIFSFGIAKFVLQLRHQQKTMPLIFKTRMRYLIISVTCFSPMIGIILNEIPTNIEPIQATSTIQRVITRRIKNNTVHCACVLFQDHDLEIGLPDDQWQKAAPGGLIRFEICTGFLRCRYIGKRSVVQPS